MDPPNRAGPRRASRALAATGSALASVGPPHAGPTTPRGRRSAAVPAAWYRVRFAVGLWRANAPDRCLVPRCHAEYACDLVDALARNAHPRDRLLVAPVCPHGLGGVPRARWRRAQSCSDLSAPRAACAIEMKSRT